MSKTTFALYFGNRGFMPESLAIDARREMSKAVADAGYDYIIMDEKATRYGSVETRAEGLIYANWLKENENAYDGIILCMPNFSDENGAIAALQDSGKPILIQAYPDEIGKMDFNHRRDAYCGKFSIEDVFHQYGVKYTVMEPHVVHPLTDAFAKNIHDFAAICRVVNGMKKFSIGAIGARTTAFKTVRFDEQLFKCLQIIGVAFLHKPDTAGFDQLRNINRISGSAVSHEPYLRRGLIARHGRGGILQNHQDKTRFRKYGIDQRGNSGVEKC